MIIAADRLRWKERVAEPVKTIGFGCPNTTDPHRFEVEIPPGRGATVSVVEYYGIRAGIGGAPQLAERCLLLRTHWGLIAEDVKREFNERLRARKLAAGRWIVGTNKVERLLGRELLVLAWAIEHADPELIPNAIRNWVGLRPEERWWLYTMTAAATGLAHQSEIGWRKALRYALTENPLSEVRPADERQSLKPKGSRKREHGEGMMSLFDTPSETPSPFLEETRDED